jgi:2-polyprenyl-3-methyl-5-hydroxy-6-metoxy-1,4-benzoquinol methylase
MNKSEKFWDRIANQWDKRGNELDEISIKAIEITKKYLNKSDILLDYGCGIGTITNEIAPLVKEIHGNIHFCNTLYGREIGIFRYFPILAQ